ncbi:ABC transporter ATP-binding protein [Reinekea blandensis]|uniref:ABC transporter, ATP-binding protein, putative n=1 Tax=Reinekea blandensis MED297 TaxID=314283 RepID=A4BE43_9GAMM|nr:ABC transporter ATP-binding protein [Reinekea blandensis]EAR09521.1 ABC transporter, ATP-binding protein, putative [Reinekea blandensis MED297]
MSEYSPGHTLIETQQLKQEVPGREGPLVILGGIDLQISAGETVAIVGASGSGKTTLLGMLAGLDTPSSGAVLIDGLDLTTMNEERRALVRGEKVGFVFQNFQLLPSLTAVENVMLSLEVRGEADARTKALSWLGRVGLNDRASHYPQQLSGGEQQRVAVARAFASQAPILFADEPTGNLDTETGRKVADLLFELNEAEGTTLVLVTHDDRLAQRCRRQLRMEAGRLNEASV